MSALKVLDLFSGIGGISLGLERTGGFKTVAFCEIDKAAQKVLQKHWPHVPIFEDVSSLKGSDIGSIDVIAGGFPCQDISVAGLGAGLEGARSGLWWEFHRLIKETNPSWVIAENVAALRSRGLDQVLGSLAAIGYDAEWHCIPASAVGAPHQRDRIWIVAYPHDLRCRRSKDSEGNDQGDDRSSPRSHVSVKPEGSGSLGENLRGSAAEAVANTVSSGSQGWLHRWADQERQGELGYLGRCRAVDGQPIENWWATEPELGRVAHGISGRTHRLKQLGNAVVPQIPELIGQAILKTYG